MWVLRCGKGFTKETYQAFMQLQMTSQETFMYIKILELPTRVATRASRGELNVLYVLAGEGGSGGRKGETFNTRHLGRDNYTGG